MTSLCRVKQIIVSTCVTGSDKSIIKLYTTSGTTRPSHTPQVLADEVFGRWVDEWKHITSKCLQGSSVTLSGTQSVQFAGPSFVPSLCSCGCYISILTASCTYTNWSSVSSLIGVNIDVDIKKLSRLAQTVRHLGKCPVRISTSIPIILTSISWLLLPYWHDRPQQLASTSSRIHYSLLFNHSTLYNLRILKLNTFTWYIYRGNPVTFVMFGEECGLWGSTICTIPPFHDNGWGL